MNLALDVMWDISPASYVRHRRAELRARGLEAALAAAIETGAALEAGDAGRARRYWRYVLEAAALDGREARRSGLGARDLIARAGRLREEVDLVLFDGRLPADLAARTARLASKMSGRWLDRALGGYWSLDRTGCGGPPDLK